MQSDTTALMLLDVMVEAGDRLAILVSESSIEAISEDWRTYDAICLGLIRIGEAAKDMPEQLKSGLTDVPWADMVALRNRIAHGYGSLVQRRVWEIASLSVPPLIVSMRRLRAQLESRD